MHSAASGAWGEWRKCRHSQGSSAARLSASCALESPSTSARAAPPAPPPGGTQAATGACRRGSPAAASCCITCAITCAPHPILSTWAQHASGMRLNAYIRGGHVRGMQRAHLHCEQLGLRLEQAAHEQLLHSQQPARAQQLRAERPPARLLRGRAVAAPQRRARLCRMVTAMSGPSWQAGRCALALEADRNKKAKEAHPRVCSGGRRCAGQEHILHCAVRQVDARQHLGPAAGMHHSCAGFASPVSHWHGWIACCKPGPSMSTGMPWRSAPGPGGRGGRRVCTALPPTPAPAAGTAPAAPAAWPPPLPVRASARLSPVAQQRR